MFANILSPFRDLSSLTGKPYAKAVMDVHGCAAVFRYYAGWCDKHVGKTVPVDGGNFAYTRKEPVGIVGQIIPWNYPLLMVCTYQRKWPRPSAPPMWRWSVQ